MPSSPRSAPQGIPPIPLHLLRNATHMGADGGGGDTGDRQRSEHGNHGYTTEKRKQKVEVDDKSSTAQAPTSSANTEADTLTSKAKCVLPLASSARSCAPGSRGTSSSSSSLPAVATPRPSPRLRFSEWEDRLRIFQREVQREFCAMEAYCNDQENSLAHATSKLQRKEREQRVVEEHKAQLQGHGLEKLSIKELEQLEAVQVMATRRTRKQKDIMVQAELARLERRIAKLEEERKCKICLERQADHVFMPCGHRCCAACLPKVSEAGKCHICRQAVSNTVRFYSS